MTIRWIKDEGLIWHSLYLHELYCVYSINDNSSLILLLCHILIFLSSFHATSTINPLKTEIHQNNIEIKFLFTHTTVCKNYQSQKINAMQENT
jgi:hypothetical protein